MNKTCEKCGFELHDDDFLCPKCGAIWGDRIYRVPVIQEAPENESEEPQTEEVKEKKPATAKKSRSKWLPVIIALFAVLLAAMLILADFGFRTGEGTCIHATTTGKPVDTIPPEYIFTFPVTRPDIVIRDPENAKEYTVRFINAYGNPVPGIKIEFPNTNPLVSMGSVIAISDSDGYIHFSFQSNSRACFSIIEVPEGYSKLGLKNAYYFADGATDLIVIVPHNGSRPGSYAIEMLDPAWLYEEMKDTYNAGSVVELKIIRVMNDVGYMMLMNGIEITAAAVAPEYLLYSFTMPSEDVTLDLKIIADRVNEDLLRDYYIQYPDKEQVSVLYDYGEYNPYLPCRAVLLKSAAEDSEPKNVLIDGISFHYVDGNDIQVYRNNRFYALNIAYANGYLTRSDLEQIQALHMELYPELYTYDTQPAVDYPD